MQSQIIFVYIRVPKISENDFSIFHGTHFIGGEIGGAEKAIDRHSQGSEN